MAQADHIFHMDLMPQTKKMQEEPGQTKNLYGGNNMITRWNDPFRELESFRNQVNRCLLYTSRCV